VRKEISIAGRREPYQNNVQGVANSVAHSPEEFVFLREDRK
jgi:hypothetical protein